MLRDALLKHTTTHKQQLEDGEDQSETIIRMMANPKPEVREMTNYCDCLQVFGLPVKSLKEVR